MEEGAPRVRKRRRRRKKGVTLRRWLRRGGIGVGVLVAVVGLLLGYQTLLVRDALTAARASLEAAEALAVTDPAAAGEHVQAARDSATRARTLSSGPHWAVARVLPVAGPSVAAVRDLADLTDAVSLLGTNALPVVGSLRRESLGFTDGRLPLEPLRQLRQTLAEADLERIRRIDARLEQRLDSLLLPLLRELTTAARTAADDLVATVEAMTLALDVAIPMLGGEGSRTYFLAVQNPGELRGTGGLMGVVTEVAVEDGAVSLGRFLSTDPDLDDPFGPGNELNRRSRLDDPVARSDDFARRWDGQYGGAFFTSANLDPDLPTAAPVILGLYERETATSLDGVLLFDALALQRLAQVTGPVDVPEEFRGGGIPQELRPRRVGRALLIDAYDVFGRSQARRDFQNAIANAVIDDVFGGGWDPADMVDAFADLLRERRLQVYSATEVEQAALEQLGAAGTVRPQRAGDLIGLVGINTAPNKADSLVEIQTTVEVELGEPLLADDDTTFVLRSLSYELELRNPADGAATHDEYISSARVPRFAPGQAELDERVGLVRNLWSLHLPAETAIDSVAAAGGPIRHGRATVHDQTIVDVRLEVESGERGAFEVRSTSRVPTTLHDDDSVTYVLTLRRQPRAVPDALDLRITPPEGWRVTDLGVEGEPPSVVLDPDLDLQSLRGRVASDGSVVVSGHVGTDVVLEVTLELA